MNNVEFSKKNADFVTCCEYSGIPATSRQASKYRRKLGKAYKFRHEAMQAAFKVKEPEIEWAA